MRYYSNYRYAFLSLFDVNVVRTIADAFTDGLIVSSSGGHLNFLDMQ